jgi:methylenetetrahydrofolate reductase (NADPH)
VTQPVRVLEGFSLEMTGKDVRKFDQARDAIPAGTRINVTFLENENLDQRVTAARTVRQAGFVPVPHIAARRLESREALKEFLVGLETEDIFAVAGDPARPHGPYADSLALIHSGLLEEHSVRSVSISGYPAGHPAISDDALWSALETKTAALSDRGMAGDIITQFGFDAEPVLTWIEQVRDRGIGLPVRVGVPGPAGVKRLVSYAARFGVSTSTGIARKYGLSLTSLMGTAGPDRFIQALADGYDARRHGDVRLHFYTFGGLAATADWISEYLK